MHKTFVKIFSIFTVSFLLIFASVQQSKAQYGGYYITGQDLHRVCNSEFDTDYGYCAGFITGVAEVMISQPVGQFRACNHGTVRSEQLINIVRKYMNNNPDTAAEDGRTIVAKSLSWAFPCL